MKNTFKILLGTMFLFICVFCFAGTTQNDDDMFQLTSEVTIGDYQYAGVVEVETESSWENLTDMATLTLPRKLQWQGRELATGEDPLIKVGDPVNLQLGYDGNNQNVFEGYVTKLDVEVPLTVHCQDAMWLLKQKTYTLSYRDAKLSDVLQDILPSILPFVAPDVRLGQLRLSKVTAAQVLSELKKKFYVTSWFRDGTLYSGLNIQDELQKTHLLNFHRNVVENNLEFVRAEDVKIKLKVISILPNNQKLELEFGEDEGEQRTLHVFDMKEKEINFFAEQQIERLKYTGYRGSLTTFLQPTVRHGDYVQLTDPLYPERNGSYLVKRVTTSFGMSGGRQVLELDAKA